MPLSSAYDATLNAPTQRLARIDALRGLAIVWMTGYHLCFDLNHFGWLNEDFYRDPFWTWQRTAIVSMFLFCAGLGQAVAVAQGQSRSRFWRRWGQIAGCALLVTLGSALMFPGSFIYFGVLHGIAVMLLVVRATAHWGQALWFAGAIAIASKFMAAHAHSIWPGLEFLNQPGLNVLGLIGRKPVTEDYVPLVPWLGVMWWGVAAGQALLARAPWVLSGPIPTPARALDWMGRWSLSWYMVHQPVLIGALLALRALKG